MKFLAFLVVLFTAVSGFVVPAPPTSSLVRSASPSSTALRMGLKEDFQKVAAGASLAALTAAPALATEGTGEPLGFESGQAVIVPLGILVAINLFFNNWAKDQPEGDFFSEYDRRV